ncbi:SIMPL domain-containing protein [Caldicellulosiruptoraceae bacterium PP1]
MINKKSFIFISSIFLIISFALIFNGNLSQGIAANQGTSSTTEIIVKGSASIFAQPDISIITAGVLSENVSADEAYKETALKINRIIDSIKKLGISTNDIKTIRVNVYPKYSYEKDTGSSKIIGFYASSDIQVTIRNIQNTGKVIDTAVKNGSNNISDIRYDVSNLDKYYNQALAKAVNVAKSKATVIADNIGVKLGKPRNVTENTYVNYPITTYNKMTSVAAQDSAIQIEPGSVEIKADITLTY